MSLSCLICGDGIGYRGLVSENKKWVKEFRTRKFPRAPYHWIGMLIFTGAEVTTRDDGELKFSGVGYLHRGYVAPLDFDVRWDDGVDWSRNSINFSMYNGLDKSIDHSDRKGFIMHSVCYSLLRQFWHPRPIPLRRLWDVACSCPVGEDGCVVWGPDFNYAGAAFVKSAFPWQEAVIYDGQKRERRPQDPWTIPELIKYLNNSNRDQSTDQENMKRRHKRSRGNKRRPAKSRQTTVAVCKEVVSNVFSRLPLEMLEHILSYTPTDDVQSLSRASKKLRTIPSSLGQVFWASRFQPPFECAWVFEAQTYEGSLDWKSLYFAMKKVPSPKLQNRRRIWRLIEWLSGILALEWSHDTTILSLGDHEEKKEWIEVHGMLEARDESATEREESDIRFEQGHIKLYSQCTKLPAQLKRITIFMAEVGSTTYITGLQFTTKAGPEICLGYLGGTKCSLETTGVHGFTVAVGSRGIQALQFLAPGGQLSNWFGDPDGIPMTRRLMAYTPITALKAGFDVRISTLLLHIR